jgi:cytochrome c553
MSVRSLLVVVVVGLVMSVSAEAAGDPARGKTLGYTCLGCHGIEGYKSVYPTFAVPRLRGQLPEYIASALKEYRKGDRSHATMHAHASTLSDQDIEDVAAYLAGVPVTSASGSKPAGTAPAAAATCHTCHGADGVSTTSSPSLPIPTLSGQHADYLAHALEAYRSGARRNPIMAPMAAQLKPEDIEALADYYARQRQSSLKTVPMKEKPAGKQP